VHGKSQKEIVGSVAEIPTSNENPGNTSHLGMSDRYVGHTYPVGGIIFLGWH